jgi:cellulose 1,4-beta-cellobiosidase
VQNNVWGDSTSQALRYDGTTFEVTNQTGMNVSSGPSAMGPVSYPSVFIGSNYNRKTSGSNLPKQVNMLTGVMTGWSHNAGSAVPGSYNAAYDVWFSTSASGDAQAPTGGYLMVWYSKPAGIQPIGRADPTPVSIPGAPGTWEVWLGQNGSRPCISYVRTEPIGSLEFDLNAFIQDAVTRPNAIKSEWYLSNVFAGFEIWSGGVGLKTTAFYAIVQ